MTRFILIIFLAFWLTMSLIFGAYLILRRNNEGEVDAKILKNFEDNIEKYGDYAKYTAHVGIKYIHILITGAILSLIALICM